MHKLTRCISVVAVIATVVALPACNTINGFGKDLSETSTNTKQFIDQHTTAQR
ncbi:MAG: small secreted protein [Planctomycetes bacterium]|nr:small secreted protein [Planctomycetota bacterium]